MTTLLSPQKLILYVFGILIFSLSSVSAQNPTFTVTPFLTSKNGGTFQVTIRVTYRSSFRTNIFPSGFTPLEFTINSNSSLNPEFNTTLVGTVLGTPLPPQGPGPYSVTLTINKPDLSIITPDDLIVTGGFWQPQGSDQIKFLRVEGEGTNGPTIVFDQFDLTQ